METNIITEIPYSLRDNEEQSQYVLEIKKNSRKMKQRIIVLINSSRNWNIHNQEYKWEFFWWTISSEQFMSLVKKPKPNGSPVQYRNF